MKNTYLRLAAIFIAITIFNSERSFAQVQSKRLPDGTVVYSDGTVRLPNGRIKYPANNGTRLPDGTVIYPNGRNNPSTYPTYPNSPYPNGGYPRRTTRQPDGSIIYPSGKIVYPDGTIRYPDGRVVYPDGAVRYPDGRMTYPGNGNGKWLPPGQAKKRYGGRARDYAPGHNKRDNEDDNEDRGKRDDDNGHRGKHHDRD